MTSHDIHLIRTAWLFDGLGTRVRNDTLLTVAGGIILRVDEYPEGRRLPAPVLDLGRATVLPPLVDCHVHLAWSGSTDRRLRRQQLSGDSQAARVRIARHLDDHFSHGILAVRDGGDHAGYGLMYRNDPTATAQTPVILKSCRALHRRGRYGSAIGHHLNLDVLFRTCLQAERRCDHIKVINSGINSLTRFAKETRPQFAPEELRELVRRAHARNMKVMVHANGREPVRQALEAGCDSLEHGFFMGRDNLLRLAGQPTTWVPTIHTIQALADRTPPRVPGIDRKVAQQTLEHQMEQLATARELGVRIALGTDSGCPGVLHGEAMAREIGLFRKAGFSLAEVIRCASMHGAELLGLEDRWGIRPGRPASFLVVRGTPAMLPRRLTRLEAIFLGGRNAYGRSRPAPVRSPQEHPPD